MRDRLTLDNVVAALAVIVTMGVVVDLVKSSSIYSFPLGQLAATIIAGALFALVVSLLRRRGAPATVKNVSRRLCRHGLLRGSLAVVPLAALWLAEHPRSFSRSTDLYCQVAANLVMRAARLGCRRRLPFDRAGRLVGGA
jgi:hypothetical protein